MLNTYVVITDFDDWSHTNKCIDAVQSSDNRESQIVVVAHGTENKTINEIESRYPHIDCLPGNPDLWWAGATNLGIRYALNRGADTILLLNNDCYVEPDTISSLLSHSSTNPGAIIAPLQLNTCTNKITGKAGTCFLLGFPTLLFATPANKRSRMKGLHKTNLIMGGRCTLIPATVFKQIGLLDESSLPHYGADHDFYLRCRKNGISLYIDYDTHVLVDNVKTSLAAQSGKIGFSEFIDTLNNRRSHRNFKDLSTLFQRHYPIKRLYMIGVVLNMIRYFMIYGWKRLEFYLTRADKES